MEVEKPQGPARQHLARTRRHQYSYGWHTIFEQTSSNRSFLQRVCLHADAWNAGCVWGNPIIQASLMERTTSQHLCTYENLHRPRQATADLVSAYTSRFSRPIPNLHVGETSDGWWRVQGDWTMAVGCSGTKRLVMRGDQCVPLHEYSFQPQHPKFPMSSHVKWLCSVTRVCLFGNTFVLNLGIAVDYSRHSAVLWHFWAILISFE